MTIENLNAASDGRAVALYYRVSTDAQDTQRQERSLPHQARQHFPDAPLVPFRDDGVSAYKTPIFERPGGRELCEAIERDAIEAVFADTQDRLSRGEDYEWLAFRELCRQHGTQIFVDGREIRNDVGGKMESYLRALIARQDSEDKSHKVRSAFKSIREDGFWRGGRVPLGYRREGPRRRAVLVPTDDAPHVRDTFHLFDNGASLTAVAHFLQERLGSRVGRDTARYILRNPVYAGWIPEGVTQNHGRARHALHEGRHEPIIDRELFRRVQERLDEYSAASARQSGVHPFAAVARCGNCGYALRYKAVTHPNYELERTYYQCEGSGCGKVRIPSEFFEAAVVLGIAATGRALRDRLDDPTWAVANPTADEAARVEADLAEVSEGIRRVVRLVGSGVVTEGDAETELATLTRQRSHLEQAHARLSNDGRAQRDALEGLRDQLATLDAHRETSDPDAAAVAFWMNATRDERLQFLSTIIDQIAFHPASDEDDAHLTITYRAGITIPVPVKTRRDSYYSRALRHDLGFGRKASLPR